ncbi:MAG: mannitol dehydrogenase family protein [Streptococcaceae bacterium]|jgi:fructuronate reductase|nr:mannitol dehydrogenase family protein [Streptococcaceae bacterium]
MWANEVNSLTKANVVLPKYDVEAMRKKTDEAPVWAHLGGGNLYRCFHAKVAQDLLNEGLMDTGVIVFDIFGKALIEEGYLANDNKTLSVIMKADGSVEKELIASTAKSGYYNVENPEFVTDMEKTFENESLQLVTVTITEKGYTVKNIDGALTEQAALDIQNGPVFEKLESTMGKVAYLMFKRFENGAAPLALVTTDNFSHNGERFKTSILTIAKGWVESGHVSEDFVSYLSDDAKVSFPFSMIDRITPLPSETIAADLKSEGIEGMEVTNPGFAAFVNTEETHYLVIEDAFPNGRPALEKAGVYMTDRDTVNNADLMKVCSCLNPLHTSLAVFGCLLGFDRIYKEMQDEDLLNLVKRVGYVEGLPVVVDPKIIDPKQFIDEVVGIRLVNPNVPDAPQRIASDTSQKVGIRFGETIKAYMESATHEPNELTFIPLTLAAWLRYLLAIDDAGAPMVLSPDPLLEELQAELGDIKLGDEVDVHGKLERILSNESIFGVNLYTAGLGEKIEEFFKELIAGPHQVRNVLHRELNK